MRREDATSAARPVTHSRRIKLQAADSMAALDRPSDRPTDRTRRLSDSRSPVFISLLSSSSFMLVSSFFLFFFLHPTPPPPSLSLFPIGSDLSFSLDLSSLSGARIFAARSFSFLVVFFSFASFFFSVVLRADSNSGNSCRSLYPICSPVPFKFHSPHDIQLQFPL